VYIRAKNISTAGITGTVDLYYANASLFLLPATWQQVVLPVSDNTLCDAQNDMATTIGTGDIALVQQSFIMNGVPTNAHYCFIALVNNNGATTPIPLSFASNDDFVGWITSNQNIAQRNIVQVPSSGSSLSSTMTFGNTDSTTQTIIFGMTGTNLPSGTTSWSAQCTDSRLDPAIYPNGFNASGTFAGNGASAMIQAPPLGSGGNSVMAMTFTFTAQSGNWPANATVEIDDYQPDPSNVAVNARLRTIPSRANDGTTETTRLLWLGSVTLIPAP
jgi:hypothetical protein